MSQVELGRQSGRLDETQRGLAEVYRWFGEGQQTNDLRRAAPLLVEHSSCTAGDP